MSIYEKDLLYLIMLRSFSLFYLLKNQMKNYDFMLIIKN